MTMRCKSNSSIFLIFSLTIFISGCSVNDFCESSDDLKNVTRIVAVDAVEIVDEKKIRVTKQAHAPVYFMDATENPLESNILGLSDSVVLADEHYGAEFKVIDITQETVSFSVNESWSYPVPGRCNPGQRSGTIRIKPYNTQ